MGQEEGKDPKRARVVLS
jgi:hypothetical protein